MNLNHVPRLESQLHAGSDGPSTVGIVVENAFVAVSRRASLDDDPHAFNLFRFVPVVVPETDTEDQLDDLSAAKEVPSPDGRYPEGSRVFRMQFGPVFEFSTVVCKLSKLHSPQFVSALGCCKVSPLESGLWPTADSGRQEPSEAPGKVRRRRSLAGGHLPGRYHSIRCTDSFHSRGRQRS